MIARFKWMLRHAFHSGKMGISAHWTSLVHSDCVLEGYNYVSKNVEIQQSKLGIFSYVNYGSRVIHADVGRFCCIGPETLIGGLGSHPTNRPSTHRMFYSRARPEWRPFCQTESFTEKSLTNVGHDVWIGARAIVLDGVTIGSGAIVAAGALVTSDVPPYGIVAGVPARLLKMRFDPVAIEHLLTQEWWNRPIEQLRELAQQGYFAAPLKSDKTS